MATTKKLEQHIDNSKHEQSITTTTTTATRVRPRCTWIQAVHLALHRQILKNGGSNVVLRSTLEEEELETIYKDAGSVTTDKKNVLCAYLRKMESNKLIATNGKGMKTIQVLVMVDKALLSVMESKEKVVAEDDEQSQDGNNNNNNNSTDQV